MSEFPLSQLFDQLGSPESEEAWSRFLEEYGTLIFQTVRHFEQNPDDVADCFQFICEQFVKDSFRRLRRFQPDGPAIFSTWLRAVVRNLCLDWHRKQFGLRRVFRSIERLSPLEQEIFRCVHEHALDEQETLVSLAPHFPQLTSETLSEAIKTINQELTGNQRWLLEARSRHKAGAGEPGNGNHPVGDAVDSRPSPEFEAIQNERRAKVERALKKLSKADKLLIRLRFEEDLTLKQIADLLELGNAQRVDRRIKEVLTLIRDELGAFSDIGSGGGKKMSSSVNAGLKSLID